MPTIEEVKDEWKIDSVIDNTKFENELIRTPILHSKYLEHLIFFRAKRAMTLRKLNTLKNIKRRYYRGEFTQSDLQEHGWKQWQGLKPSMSELNQLFEQDEDLNIMEEKLEYYNTALVAVEYIMKAINTRSYEIKTLLDYNKFIAGG